MPIARKSRHATSSARDGSTLSLASSLSQVSGSVKSASAPSSKKIKTTLSTCSVSQTTIDQDIASQDAANDDHASTVRSDSDDSDLEIVKVDPEKELGTSLNTFVERS